MAVVTVVDPAAGSWSDEQLLARYRAGDRSALEDLFRRYRAVAYRVAFRLLGNEADALDAVQDGFIKVLANLAGFEGRSSFKTWLLRVVSNASLDVGRARGRRDLQREDSLPADWEAPARPTDVEMELERADLRRLLDQALAQLPEPQRQAFVLHVDGELSYRDIATAMDISIGTVMSRLFYARQKLRSMLAERVL